jgi:hypothetical protein
MHCIYVGVSYVPIAIGHVEQGPEETSEPTQAEGVNPEQDQGKPRYI